MSHLPIPLAVIYAGLAGTVLALIVATATNRWSPRVFFLLALRLAIGWHFLFEGLYKVQTYYTGPIEVNGKMQRPFSSEPYFKVAPGPLGAKMRKEFGDNDAEIARKVKAPEAISPADFAKLPVDQQAAKCPEAVAKQIDAIREEPDKDRKKANETEAKAMEQAPNDEVKAIVKARGDAARAAADKKAAYLDSPEAKDKITKAKAAYARWVYGVDVRDCKVKTITGDVPLTGPQRIEHLEWLRKKANDAAARETDGLGNGYGTDHKRVAEFRMDALTAESDLVRDANSFIADLKKELNGGKAIEEEKVESRGHLLDRITMWFLVVIGAFLMGGLFTRLACLLATGFLVMTYLAHPPFPWYPLPPNTEGNPVFINKNVIEALALLTLACYPTGRWLGLDAIVLRPLCKYKGECPTPPPSATPTA
jgi:uncharacterized membrane protein YphA (DoxX/SURF4 family)